MISDVLNDAVLEIDGYLGDDTFKDAYSGTLREAIIELRNRMDAMRVMLDTLPSKMSDA